MASSESQARLTQSEPAKWIVVYKNGDQNFAGRRMVVKPREIRTFDSLLEEVTVKLNPSFGAVRNIFTPEGGTRVSSLTDLKPNGHYVASRNEPFRQLSSTRYGAIPAQSTSQSHSRVSLQPSKDKVRRHPTVPPRRRSVGSDEFTIHVYRNGDAFAAATPLRVDRPALTNWRETLARLGEKLQVRRGALKLYNLRGQLVRDPATDLAHNGLYVAAADNESFRLVNYGASRESLQSVTRGDSRTSTPHIPRARQRVAESAPDLGYVPTTPRLPAHRSSSPSRRPSEGAHRAPPLPPLPPLRMSYPQLARRYSQLKDKCALHEQKAKGGNTAAAKATVRKAVSEISLPTIRSTSRSSQQKPRSRSRGVSLPPAVPGARSRASVRGRSTDGARAERRTAVESEDDAEREDGDDEEREDGEREEYAEREDEKDAEWEDGERMEREDEERRGVGRADSAYGSDTASPPVKDDFRLSESEYFKAKETPRQVVQLNLDRDVGGIYRSHSSDRLPPELPDAADVHTEVPLEFRAAQQVNEELIMT